MQKPGPIPIGIRPGVFGLSDGLGEEAVPAENVKGDFPVQLAVLRQKRALQDVCRFRFLAMVLTTSSMTIGLDRCPFMPAASERCTSSAKALAVIAMMGMVRPSGLPAMVRMALVAS